MPSSHLILCRPLLLLPPIPPSTRVFSNESTLHMRWPKYWSFSFSSIPSGLLHLNYFPKLPVRLTAHVSYWVLTLPYVNFICITHGAVVNVKCCELGLLSPACPKETVRPCTRHESIWVSDNKAGRLHDLESWDIIVYYSCLEARVPYHGSGAR